MSTHGPAPFDTHLINRLQEGNCVVCDGDTAWFGGETLSITLGIMKVRICEACLDRLGYEIAGVLEPVYQRRALSQVPEVKP